VLRVRQAIFLTYGKMEPRTADRVAELLSFDPALVMPQLRAHAAPAPVPAGGSGSAARPPRAPGGQPAGGARAAEAEQPAAGPAEQA